MGRIVSDPAGTMVGPTYPEREGHMGFSGTFVVLRHDGAPLDLARAAGFDPGPVPADFQCDHAADPDTWELATDGAWAGEWRVWRCYAAVPDGLAQALTRATGSGVLTCQVLHSDGGKVEGFGPRTGRWAAWLMVWRAADYFDQPVDFDEDEVTEEEARELYQQAERAVIDRLLLDAPGGEPAARQVVAWAAEAGLDASPEAVLAILDGHRVFAEELFYDLLAVLGIRVVDRADTDAVSP